MNYLGFRYRFIELGAFSVHQIGTAFPNFDRNNLTRWQRKGLLMKLRQGFYAFPEYVPQPNFSFFVSNYIYKPSYVSLHTALAFYGIIPEAVTQITAVSALKTTAFENGFGTFSYMKIKQDLFFGYDILPLGNRSIHIAQPEKAILDLLYLYPFYNTKTEIENLRMDEDFVHNDLNMKRLSLYLEKFNNKKLAERVTIFTDLYKLKIKN
jgi:predicted transcriptional regulator of viral defense system